jgi:SAM-dependent methyltransferase
MAPVGSLDLSYEVRGCPRCGAVFSDRLAPREDYGRYYAAMSKHDLEPVADGSDSGRCHRELARLLGGLAPADGRILDIGCGTGHLLSCLREAGFGRLAGLDPSPRSAASARDHFGLDCVQAGSIDSAAGTPGLDGLDVCCLTGVLEHLHSPLEQLGAVVGRLRPGARLAVGVPDLDSFTAEGREPFGELSLEHVNFFSRRSLAAFLGRLGCRLEACVSFPGKDESNLLAVAVKDGQPARAGAAGDVPAMEAYLAASSAALAPRLASLAARMSRRTIVYGAGSHTARLLPRLAGLGLLGHCVALVDRNPNLQGRAFGGLPVFPPDCLVGLGDGDILVSSFRFEGEIAAALEGMPNAILTIYLDPGRASP